MNGKWLAFILIAGISSPMAPAKAQNRVYAADKFKEITDPGSEASKVSKEITDPGTPGTKRPLSADKAAPAAAGKRIAPASARIKDSPITDPGSDK